VDTEHFRADTTVLFQLM